MKLSNDVNDRMTENQVFPETSITRARRDTLRKQLNNCHFVIVKY